ncbi:hypothetical protein T4B_3421 [Trichinella pseudospiralis]|uniref:Uncharacterized protein n=1 Tax=Trichinella pseudospiralis TaxID=6337 RepID=A0A0V1GSY5_TRIPS|nr:hypothetical protein T4B_3421 [Trichinella pseudospiralis]
MDFNVKSWNQKIVYGRARSRNVQAADMVVYVQNNLWSSLQSTLPPPGQIKFLWSLVADVYVSFYGRFFVPITMEMDYIEFDMLNTLGISTNLKTILAPGVAPGYASGHKKICICLQAMPSAFYCTIFALRLCQNLHMQNFCAFRLRLGALPEANF